MIHTIARYYNTTDACLKIIPVWLDKLWLWLCLFAVGESCRISTPRNAWPTFSQRLPTRWSPTARSETAKLVGWGFWCWIWQNMKIGTMVSTFTRWMLSSPFPCTGVCSGRWRVRIPLAEGSAGTHQDTSLSALLYFFIWMFWCLFIFNPLEEYGCEVAEKRHYLRCSVWGTCGLASVWTMNTRSTTARQRRHFWLCPKAGLDWAWWVNTPTETAHTLAWSPPRLFKISVEPTAYNPVIRPWRAPSPPLDCGGCWVGLMSEASSSTSARRWFSVVSTFSAGESPSWSTCSKQSTSSRILAGLDVGQGGYNGRFVCCVRMQLQIFGTEAFRRNSIYMCRYYGAFI